MPALFQKPKMPKTTMPKPVVPPVPEIEEAGDVAGMGRKRRGRRETVITGELEPMDIGKRTLLG